MMDEEEPMNLTLQLPPEIEAKLKEQAAQSGRSVEEIVLAAIGERVSPQDRPGRRLSKEEWAQRFDAWIASHPVVTHPVDDGREQIYEGRGE